MSDKAPEQVRDYLCDLQQRIVQSLEAEDDLQRFRADDFPGERGGLARPCVLENGSAIERAAVNFSHTKGSALPAAATLRRPELKGRTFQAVSLSMIVHPRNPYAPTTHMNVRYFQASKESEDPVWWFGGGFDLTPYYPFLEDAVHWHETAKKACETVDPGLYPRFKKNCDEYFFLKHRQETRGVGGLFFDDYDTGGFENGFQLMQSVGDQFLPAYLPILQRRKTTPYGHRERQFQLYRRGRYVEFNLLYDRGTLFGLQSGGRIESILGSMPPLVAWQYDYQPEPGSPEAELAEYLKPRDWLGS